MERLRSIDDLKTLRERLSREFFSDRPKAMVCCGTPCIALGSPKVIEEIESEANAKGVDLEIVKTGCQGLCQRGPLLRIEPYDIYYQRITPEDARWIVTYTVAGGRPYRQSLFREDIIHEPFFYMTDWPFYKKQLKIVLANNDRIDPMNIYHYIAVGGYRALEKALSEFTPEHVLDEVDKANIRGRGGAGFPAGKKWRLAKEAPSDIKFVIANGDEGDPGAFMDRAVMEGDPHSVLEGMLLCAYAIGAKYGFIYVRHEYPLAVRHLRHAIRQAEEIGVLGENILGTDFTFYLDVREGAGAFVCGEETALIASIEGKRGMPRPRPPFPVHEGLFGKPTVVNNVETLANIPHIITKGAQWFTSLGTENSKGTKVFALAGKVKNTGLVEVPMGITLREIIFDIGEGIIGDKRFKAVQTGGPSGGCIPEELLDIPVDFDSLTEVGSMMGSGGMVVMDEDTCMVDLAKYFLSFTQSESCGKCPPCRIGTYQMLKIMERICSGQGEDGDIERLERIGRLVQKASLCGLGKTAPNPVLSTIRYFREEYEEHIYDKYCRAKVCRGLGIFSIDQKSCIRCGLCKQACAHDAVKETKDTYFIEKDYCTKCNSCYMVCPIIGAIKIEKSPPKLVSK